mmetsp:Transcript_29597/g.74454  ORF Transcript_29597/g.74454 Transcript_29597/m.74454 type:complete len:300 (-) Transcript_29597:316-1215(-)
MPSAAKSVCAARFTRAYTGLVGLAGGGLGAGRQRSAHSSSACPGLPAALRAIASAARASQNCGNPSGLGPVSTACSAATLSLLLPPSNRAIARCSSRRCPSEGGPPRSPANGASSGTSASDAPAWPATPTARLNRSSAAPALPWCIWVMPIPSSASASCTTSIGTVPPVGSVILAPDRRSWSSGCAAARSAAAAAYSRSFSSVLPRPYSDTAVPPSSSTTWSHTSFALSGSGSSLAILASSLAGSRATGLAWAPSVRSCVDETPAASSKPRRVSPRELQPLGSDPNAAAGATTARRGAR